MAHTQHQKKTRLSKRTFLRTAEKIAYKLRQDENKLVGLPGKGRIIELWYSKIDDSRIGDDETFRALIKKGVTEQIQSRRDGGPVAQIGFNPEKQKWYGWSHRAGQGFGIGYKVKKGEIMEEFYKAGYTPKTLEDCKKMAMVFADSAS